MHGLVGLYEGGHTGRRQKWTQRQQEELRALADSQGGTVGALLREIPTGVEQAVISEITAKRYLKADDFRYKRYRYSLKKSVRKTASNEPEE